MQPGNTALNAIVSVQCFQDHQTNEGLLLWKMKYCSWNTSGPCDVFKSNVYKKCTCLSSTYCQNSSSGVEKSSLWFLRVMLMFEYPEEVTLYWVPFTDTSVGPWFFILQNGVFQSSKHNVQGSGDLNEFIR